MSTKEQVLNMLLEEKQAVSGENLARRLGVSRTAIWKAIGQLRKEGYDILARTNRGYQMAESEKDRISEGEIRRWLTTGTMGQRMEVYHSLNSTNLRGRAAASEGAPEGTLIVADSQTDGRGRFGRRFFSPAYTGVYLSLVLRPQVHTGIAARITSLAAVAVARAIEKVTGTEVQIKWVNDLYLNGRKLGGILCEASVEVESRRMEAVILGIGINVGRIVFPKELEGIATSLGNECGAEVSRCQLIAEICNQLESLYPQLSTGEFLEECRSRSCVLGREVSVHRGGERYRAKAVDIDAEGRLVVETPEGTRTLDSGEISLRLEDSL